MVEQPAEQEQNPIKHLRSQAEYLGIDVTPTPKELLICLEWLQESLETAIVQGGERSADIRQNIAELSQRLESIEPLEKELVGFESRLTIVEGGLQSLSDSLEHLAQAQEKIRTQSAFIIQKLQGDAE